MRGAKERCTNLKDVFGAAGRRPRGMARDADDADAGGTMDQGAWECSRCYMGCGTCSYGCSTCNVTYVPVQVKFHSDQWMS